MKKTPCREGGVEGERLRCHSGDNDDGGDGSDDDDEGNVESNVQLEIDVQHCPRLPAGYLR